MSRVPTPDPSALARPITKQSPLLERLRLAAQDRGDAGLTADYLVRWARAFILFHNKRHPSELGLAEATHFLEHVVKTAAEPLLALAQARSALMLLYESVLGINLGELPQPRPPRLLDQLRLVLRVRHYSPRTEDCYVQWAKRFIFFHHKRHPRAMGAAEVEQFLTHLAVEGHISASSQNQALNALLFVTVHCQFRPPLRRGGLGGFKRDSRCRIHPPQPPLRKGGRERLPTMIYTHVARKGVAGLTSPLDLLDDVNADDVQAIVAATRALEQPQQRDQSASVPFL